MKKIISTSILLILIPTLGFAQLTKTHSIGKIHDSFKDMGSLLFKDKDSKMRWDDFGGSGIATEEDLIMGRGIWLGARNVTDVFNQQKPYFAALCGFFSEDEGIPVSIEKYIRYAKPSIAVNDGTGLKLEAPEVGSVVVQDLISDESIVASWKTPLGVNITLTTYAFGQPGQNEYILQEYVLKNTGDMDEDDDQDQNQVLEDFWFGITYMPIIGRSTQDDLYGYFGRNYVQDTDSIRMFYHWDGDNSQTLGFDASRGAAETIEDDTGDPDLVDGSIRFHPYIGFAVLHADASPHEPGVITEDDPEQPRTVHMAAGDHTRHAAPNADQILYEEIARGTIIDDAVTAGVLEWPTGTSKSRTMIGFGPYNTFELGQEIRIVVASVIGGVSTLFTEKMGQDEFGGLVSTEERLALLKTGLDSLKHNALRAQIAFRNGYNLPDPPPPPESLQISSQGGHVLIEWADNARTTPDFDSGVSDFAGYYVYRAVGSADRTFELIETITKQELESGLKSTSFQDYDVSRGVIYYYRITSFDDGTQNWLTPGIALESGHTAGNTAIGVPAFSEPVTNSGDLDQVVVIPNPYNIFGVYNFPGEALERNKILFSNLPPTCTIRIYTVSGDHVQTIQHVDGSGDESWDLINISNQLVMSGIYIAHIDSDIGDQVVKFIIVR